MKFNKKHVVQIPKNVNVLYCRKKNVLTFLGLLRSRSIEPDLEIFLFEKPNYLVVGTKPRLSGSKQNKKTLEMLRGTTVSKIKQSLLEITYNFNRRLSFVGIGYKAFNVPQTTKDLYFKLGYSHSVYFRIYNFTKVFCLKSSKIILSEASSFEKITQTADFIIECKRP